jgi:hypothetical protein
MKNFPTVSVFINSLDDSSQQVLSIFSVYENYRNLFNLEVLVSGGVPEVIKNQSSYPQLDFSKITFAEDQGTSVSSINEMFRKSNGDYILNLNGKILPRSNFFNLVTEMQEQEKNGEKIVATGPSEPNKTACWIPQEMCDIAGLDKSGSERPKIIRFPALSRKTILNHLDGVIFNESFRHHYVDNWLGQYAALIGSPIKESSEICYDNYSSIPQVNKHDVYDKETYIGLSKAAKELKSKISYNHEINVQ